MVGHVVHGHFFSACRDSSRRHSYFVMGVYVFRSLRGAFIKVGHYRGQNAWSRVAHRGFRSCICPQSIEGCVSIDDLELVAWFPALTTLDERRLHRHAKKRSWSVCGEWLHESCLRRVVELLRAAATRRGTVASQHRQCDRAAALRSRRRL